jgi:hypothetical protein
MMRGVPEYSGGNDVSVFAAVQTHEVQHRCVQVVGGESRTGRAHCDNQSRSLVRIRIKKRGWP